jgi:hypothetical protein
MKSPLMSPLFVLVFNNINGIMLKKRQAQLVLHFSLPLDTFHGHVKPVLALTISERVTLSGLAG